MKRVIGLVLTAVFLSVLCVPCAAADAWPLKQRGYPGFSDISSASSPYFDAVKTCYELGWMDPAGGDTFGVNEPVTGTETITLLAHLYSVRHGGRGVIPPLPEDLGDFVRFYDADGSLVHNLTTAYCPDFYGNSQQEITVLFWEEYLSPETLVMEVGFPGDGVACTASGVRMGYDSEKGYTKYRFTLPEGAAAQELDLEMAYEDLKGWQSTFQVNQREGITDDPTPYDAIFYLEYREPARLPLCFRNISLSSLLYHPVWRAEFATPLSGLCAGLPEPYEDASAPDLPGQWAGYGDILSLYRMGILRGFDEAGTFGGRECLTRGQAAVIVRRVLDILQPELFQA